MNDLGLSNLEQVFRKSENESFKLVKVHLHSSMRFLSLHANCITDKKDIESLSQQRSLNLDGCHRAFEEATLCKVTCLIQCLIRRLIYHIDCAIQRDSHIYTSSNHIRFSFRIHSKTNEQT